MTKITLVSKKMLSLLMTLLMLCSCMVVASAAEPTVSKPEITLNAEDKSITVVPMDPVDDLYDVTITIEPEASRGTAENGDVLFYNLTMGQKYTVYATITVDGKDYSNSDSVTLKKAQAAPTAQAAKEVTSTSIEISAITGGEYMIEGKGITEPAYGSKTKFTDLTPNESYTIYIRFKETDDKYASEATKLVVKTLKASSYTEAPDAPVLADKTMNSITVVEQSGILYSIDGKNWQSSGKFTGLKAGVTYSIYAMYDYDKTEEEAGPVSKPLDVKTNTKANSPATLDDCKITINTNENNYANEPINFSVEVNSAYVTNKAEYGDTIYIPTSYQINDGEKVNIPLVKGTKFTAAFTPGVENANKTIKFTINFTKMKYTGGTEWVNVGEETSTVHKIDVGPEHTIWVDIAAAFTGLFNLLFDTLPGMLSDFLNSDAVGGYFDFFLGLGDIDIGGILEGLGAAA